MEHRNIARRRGVLISLASIVALVVTGLGVATATAAPATDGWHEGACQQGEGLTVIVDFGVDSDRDPEVRCRVGGTYGDGEPRVTALEAVGYEVSVAGSGLVVRIDGVGNDSGMPEWWKFTAVEGEGAWNTSTGWTVPRQATNWFQGVCLSQSGCDPRPPAEFAEGTYDPGPTDPDPTAKAPSKLKVAWATKPSAAKRGKIQVKVPRVAGYPKASGKVVVKLQRAGKKNKKVAKKLPAGKVKVRLAVAKLASGKWNLVVAYAGDASYKRAKMTK